MSRKTGSLNFQGVARIFGLPSSTAAGEPVIHEQLENAIGGLKQKDPVTVRTTGNIDLASPGTTIATVDMSTAPNKRFLVAAQTTNTQNGVYFWNGAAVPATRTADANSAAELNSALVPVVDGADAGKDFRQTALITTLGTDPITFAQFGTSAAQATESSAGIAEIATQAETDTGTDDLRLVTPLKLANYSRLAKRYNNVFGDGSATQFTFTHNFNTRDVVWDVKDNSGNFPSFDVDFDCPTVNTSRVTFEAGLAPSASGCRIVILA